MLECEERRGTRRYKISSSSFLADSEGSSDKFYEPFSWSIGEKITNTEIIWRDYIGKQRYWHVKMISMYGELPSQSSVKGIFVVFGIC